jgi:hypothetical protein
MPAIDAEVYRIRSECNCFLRELQEVQFEYPKGYKFAGDGFHQRSDCLCILA